MYYVDLLKAGGEKRGFPESSFGALPVSQGPVSQRGELWLTKTAEKTKPQIYNPKSIYRLNKDSPTQTFENS